MPRRAPGRRPCRRRGSRPSVVVRRVVGLALDGRGLVVVGVVDLLTLAIEILLVEGGPEVAVLVRGEVAAIEVYRDLDLCLVGIAVEAAGARHFGGGVRGVCMFLGASGLPMAK